MKNRIKEFEEIIKAINSEKINIDEVLRLIMDNISKLISAKAWSLLLLDKKNRDLVFKVVIGEKNEELTGKRMPMDKGVVGWVMKNKKSVIVSEPYQDKRFFKDIDKNTGFITENILAIPLINKGRILGVIEAINKVDGTNFDQKDLKSVCNFAEHAAIALENANLVQSLQNKVRYLTLISNINKNITSILDLETLLKKSTKLIQKTFDYYYVGIGLFEDDKIILKGFSAAKNIKPFRTLINKGEGLVGKVMNNMKRIIILDTEKELDFCEGIKGVKSEMVIPIKRETNFLGIIDIGSPEKYAFSVEEADIVSEVSHQLATAVENAKLYQKIRLAAITDDLTGLYNSRFCNKKLPGIVNKWRKEGKVGSLIFMDIDHFKNINDSYNHLIGSKLLHLVARRIKEVLDEGKIGIRYGGDEYIILMEDMELEKAIDFTKEIKNLISSRPYTIGDDSGEIKCNVKASFGIASFPDVTTDPQELLRLADLAMYYVKANGRDNIAYMDKNADIQLLNEQTNP
ncbi:sensor domain-containing diguanylate cyclase [candidate division WOR-3 bacterium]|nr:sensor domain-containing diguanylate cyclase [candidate division WOR-3 bacterium]